MRSEVFSGRWSDYNFDGQHYNDANVSVVHPQAMSFNDPLFEDPTLPSDWRRRVTQRKSGASARAWDVYIFAPLSHNNKMFRSKPRPPPTTSRGTPFPRGGACPHWGCILVPHCHVAWAYIMLPTRDVVWGTTPHTTAGFAALHLTDSTAIFPHVFTTSGIKYLTHNSQFTHKPSYFRSFLLPMRFATGNSFILCNTGTA